MRPSACALWPALATPPAHAFDSLALRTRLTDPTAVAFAESDGVLYFADRAASVQQNGLTRHVARIFTVQSTGRLTLLLSTAACGTSACPEAVHSMAVAPDGALVFSDIVGQRIFRLPRGQTLPIVIAGDGTAGDAADGTPAVQARVHAPAGLAFMTDGRLVFAEQLGQRVRFIEADGRLGTLAGTGTAGFAGDGGPATRASLRDPAGLAILQGQLWIADRDNNRVRSVDLSSGIMTTIAGQGGVAAFAGDDGPALDARFDRPDALAVSADGRTLFIADSGNDRVRAIDLASGTIHTFAGNGNSAFNGNGRAAGDTSIRTPSGLATSELGLLFLSDFGHAVIWRTQFRF